MRKRTDRAKSAPLSGKRRTGLPEIESRVNAAWAFVGVMRPDLKPAEKQTLAERLLDLCNVFEPGAQARSQMQITGAQVTEMVWRNSQCIQKSCPMLLFSDRMAEELNEFFTDGE